jgi:type II secretory pathway component PulF
MEPGAIVIIGVVMGWIILSVLGPVYDLIAGM